MAGALEGVKVLELTRVGPGAFCTMMLADMGAEVLKVEAPPSGKLAGSGASPTPDQAKKLATNFTNRNKKSITLNLKEAAGQAVLQDLSTTYDVLVEGFRPGVMLRLGGDYDTLSKLNPRLVYCSLSGFGQDGPYRDYPAHDLNYLALGGVLNLIGQPEGPPAIPLNIIADYAGASMHGVSGIMFALFARERTGKANWSMCPISTPPSHYWQQPLTSATIFLRETVPGRGKGVFGGGFAYYSVYNTKDNKQLSIGCTEPWLWNNLCDTLERPEWKDCGMQVGDFSQTTTARHQQVRQELQAVLMTKTRDEWYDLLAKPMCVSVRSTTSQKSLQIPKSATANGRRAGSSTGWQSDPGRCRRQLSDTPGSIRSFAPSIGEHTEAVLSGLGYSPDKIAELREKRVV